MWSEISSSSSERSHFLLASEFVDPFFPFDSLLSSSAREWFIAYCELDQLGSAGNTDSLANFVQGLLSVTCSAKEAGFVR